MKKIFLLFFGLSAMLFASIGEISAVRGKVTIHRDGDIFDAKLHTQLQKHDKIETSKKSKVQIIFNDNTVISLGQKSFLSVDEYIFNKKRVDAKFNVRGIFKSITGKIGHISPKNFKLKTANATIGVRGTTIIGESKEAYDDIICSSGVIIVSTPLGERVVRKGERTIVKRGYKPTPPKPIKLTTVKKEIKSIAYEKIDADVERNIVKKEIENESSITTDVVVKSDKVKESKEDWGEWESTKNIVQKVEKIKKRDKKESKPGKIKDPSKEKQKSKKENPNNSKKSADPIQTNPNTSKNQSSKTDSKPISTKPKDNPNSIKNPNKSKKDSIKSDNPQNDFNDPIQNIPDLQNLRDRLGDNPSYQGDIKGFDNSGQINGDIKLNLDLGKGSVSGDMDFNQDKWDSTITNGKINARGEFDFELKGDQATGNGDGRLSGDNLENANGSFRLENKSDNNKAFGFFKSNRVMKQGSL
jgi:hypothetical protein